jgi:hypothetical protein
MPRNRREAVGRHNEGVDRREREEILGEWGIREQTPRIARQEARLREDLQGSPLQGKPLRSRLRNFHAEADSYVSALGGPLPYMQRLRTIADEEAAHERALAAAWHAVAAEARGDAAIFARRWRRVARRWDFGGVNELIEKHNRYFPAESRLPMDPRTGDFALVGGKPYRREPLGPEWVLERFPPLLELAVDAA